MNRSIIFPVACSFALAALALAGCKKDEAVPAKTGQFTLHMDNGVTVAGASGTTFSPLVLGTGAYTNANGDDFTVSTFKYYVSNVTLLKADNSTYTVPKTYFLVDHDKPATQDLTMTDVPAGEYTAVRFVLGVDSARTKAGNYTEEVLNASKGMYWDMNGPEFINLKLEGYSSKSRSGGLIFHIAGYKHSTTNTIRTVTIPFATAKANLVVSPDHSPEVHMWVDITKLFTGPNLIRFAETSNIMGGIPAAKIADNAQAGLFTAAHIHAN